MYYIRMKKVILNCNIILQYYYVAMILIINAALMRLLDIFQKHNIYMYIYLEMCTLSSLIFATNMILELCTFM